MEAKILFMKRWSAKLLHSKDTPNPDNRIAGFDTIQEACSETVLSVLMLPEIVVKKPGLAFNILPGWTKVTSK